MIKRAVRRTLFITMARVLLTDEQRLALTDNDIDAGNLPFADWAKVLIDDTTDALLELLETEIEQRVGAAITTIREAEGIDPDQVDQALGVQPEDL